MSDRLRHLAYRCISCRRLLTCLEIEATWEKAERILSLPSSSVRPSASLCSCGGRHIRPTNPTLAEELFLPRVWKLWIVKVVKPWLKAKFA